MPTATTLRSINTEAAYEARIALVPQEVWNTPAVSLRTTCPSATGPFVTVDRAELLAALGAVEPKTPDESLRGQGLRLADRHGDLLDVFPARRMGGDELHIETEDNLIYLEAEQVVQLITFACGWLNEQHPDLARRVADEASARRALDEPEHEPFFEIYRQSQSGHFLSAGTIEKAPIRELFPYCPGPLGALRVYDRFRPAAPLMDGEIILVRYTDGGITAFTIGLRTELTFNQVEAEPVAREGIPATEQPGATCCDENGAG